MSFSIAKAYRSPEMKAVIKEIDKINEKNTIFFVYGDKGTEKEYIAQLIQNKAGYCSKMYIDELKELKPSVKYIILSDFDLSSVKGEIVFTEFYETLLNSHKIYIPPLKERKQDIIPLSYFFLKEIEEFLRLPSKELTKDAKEALVEHPWPENTYELKRVLTKAYILTRGKKITSRDLFSEYKDRFSIRDFLEAKIGGFLKDFENLKNSNLYSTVMQEVEKALIDLALSETGGNQLKASKILGINRNTLNKKIKQYSLI